MRRRKRIAVLSSAQSEENRKMLQGIGRYRSDEKNWDVFVIEEESNTTVMLQLEQGYWDGVINDRSNSYIPIACKQLNIPCVDTNTETPSIIGIPKIRLNDFAIGQFAGDHLINLGYRFFGYSGFSNSSSLQRQLGFQNALNCANGSFPLFEFNSELDTTFSNSTKSGSEEDEIETLQKWLRSLPQPTAIFACSDQRASQIEKACNREDLIIPQEIALIGASNNSFICELSHTTLSSIDLNDITRGALAAKTLQSLFEGEKDIPAETLLQPLEIVTRQSTDSAAVSDDLVSRALSIIRDHARNGLRVEELVTKASSSRRMLERRFKKHLGKTPNTVIREAQIAEIKRNLTHTDKSLAEIAYDTGFQNPEYMHVVFKRETGITPGRYRQKHLVAGYCFNAVVA